MGYGDRKTLKLTKKEQKDYLDAKIRRSARWDLSDVFKSGDGTSLMGSTVVDDKTLKQISQTVYDSIVSSYDYDERLLAATRSVKFKVSYVQSVLKKGLDSGTIKIESVIMDGKVKLAITENMNGKRFRKVS